MRFDLPEGLKLVHEMRIPVRWGDLDAMGLFKIPNGHVRLRRVS